MVDDLFDIEQGGGAAAEGASEGASGGADEDEAPVTVVLRVHVQPGAGRSAATGRYGDALKVRVAAPPEGGRANQATVALVASLVGVKENQVELAGGESSRSKRVRVQGVRLSDLRRLLTEAIASGNAGPGPGVSRSAH